MSSNEYDISQEKLFQDFIIERNLRKETIKSYKSALQKYCTFHQMTLSELIDEADTEEEMRVRAKNRKIIRRLRDFRTYMIHNKNEVTTVTGYYTKIRTFYRHNLIEIPYIPPVQLQRKQVMYEDIPHKHHIIEALQHTSNLKHKAIIYFISSSGSARTETCNITIQDFIDATYDYHHSSNIPVALESLENESNVIPLFQLTRQKTGYRYYTACTGEATQHILRYLKNRGYKNLQPTDKLFDIKQDGINKLFARINDSCRFPKGFLHPHALRSYHTDIIQDKQLSQMLQGRKPDPITEAYFKQNPKRVKEKYMEHLKDLTLQPTKVVTIESDEVRKLKRQHKNEMRELESKMKKEVSAIRKMMNSLLEEYEKKGSESQRKKD